MTHRFFVRADQIDDACVRFDQAQIHQLESVLRLRAGDQVRVFDGVQPCDRVVELDSPGHGVVVGEAAQAAEPKTRLVVYPALLQRDKFEVVLQKLTEIGAAAIVPVITARSLVHEAPDERRYGRWRAILREAAEQSGRGIVPDLLSAQIFDAAVAGAAGTVLVASPEAGSSLRDVLRDREEYRSVSVFVGPEGGLTPAELDSARAAGAQLVTLGSRVLRTETASPVLAALVLYELGDLT